MQLPYRIEYSDVADVHSKHNLFSPIFMTILFFSVFITMVSLFWPEGREVLRLMVIPGSAEETMEAVETFVSELDCGIQFKSAAADFFRNLIRNETAG